jgi:hypothetical protein
MLKKEITYTDYDGNVRTEVFYFNMNKAEITEMEMSEKGGLSEMLKKIIGEKDNKRMIDTFKDLILKAYGVKSADGKVFKKTQELRDEFSQTEAYVELFMELASDADAAATFVRGIIPNMKDAIANVNTIQNNLKSGEYTNFK